MENLQDTPIETNEVSQETELFQIALPIHTFNQVFNAIKAKEAKESVTFEWVPVFEKAITEHESRTATKLNLTYGRVYEDAKRATSYVSINLWCSLCGKEK